MTTQHKLLPLAVLCLLLSVFTACTDSDRDKDGVADDRDKCPTEFAKTKDGCPVKKELGKIRFYVDNSASMGAYFKDPEFNEVVSDLSVKVDKKIKPVEIWYIADEAVKYSGDARQFSTDIATTKYTQQKSSQLHKMIADIAATRDSNDVAFLVSDCILSFPDADIKKNPEINRTSAASTLKNDIFGTFADLKKKGLATSVYAFTAKPTGTYYTYQNARIPMNGNYERPFYVWVIADKTLLADFNAQLADISTFKPEKELHFGLSEEPVKKYEIIPQIERTGSWMKTSDGIEQLKQDDQFCIAVNLNTLPAYARNKKYLEKHLDIEQKGCKVDFEVKEKEDVNKSKLKSEPQIRDFEASTHFIIITLKEMPAKDAAITLDLPLEYDTWFKEWSTMDDRNIAAADEKTFAFEHLINGVREAYDTKNNSYLHFSLSLKK